MTSCTLRKCVQWHQVPLNLRAQSDAGVALIARFHRCIIGPSAKHIVGQWHHISMRHCPIICCVRSVNQSIELIWDFTIQALALCFSAPKFLQCDWALKEDWYWTTAWVTVAEQRWVLQPELTNNREHGVYHRSSLAHRCLMTLWDYLLQKGRRPSVMCKLSTAKYTKLLLLFPVNE